MQNITAGACVLKPAMRRPLLDMTDAMCAAGCSLKQIRAAQQHLMSLGYPKSRAGKEAATSFVYVIGQADGPLKIGVSSDVEKRRKSLQTASHKDFLIIHLSRPMRRKDAFAVERDSHQQLAAHAVGGEWFSCTAEEARCAIERAHSDVLGFVI